MGDSIKKTQIKAPLHDLSKVDGAIAKAVVVASTTFRPDQIRRYKAVLSEQTESGPK